jgi:hypothetical protein
MSCHFDWGDIIVSSRESSLDLLMIDQVSRIITEAFVVSRQTGGFSAEKEINVVRMIQDIASLTNISRWYMSEVE